MEPDNLLFRLVCKEGKKMTLCFDARFKSKIVTTKAEPFLTINFNLMGQYTSMNEKMKLS